MNDDGFLYVTFNIPPQAPSPDDDAGAWAYYNIARAYHEHFGKCALIVDLIDMGAKMFAKLGHRYPNRYSSDLVFVLMEKGYLLHGKGEDNE